MSDDSQINNRLSVLEKTFELQINTLNERFDRMDKQFEKMEDTFEKIESHIARSVEFNERVNSMVGQMSSLMNQVNGIRKEMEEHKEEDLAFHTKVKTWGKAGILILGALWTIAEFVVPLFLNK